MEGRPRFPIVVHAIRKTKIARPNEASGTPHVQNGDIILLPEQMGNTPGTGGLDTWPSMSSPVALVDPEFGNGSAHG